MSSILITGSTDGIGYLAARNLIAQGHTVTVHARNADRAAQARKALPGASGILVGDLASLTETKQLAADANKANQGRPFDVVIHNAGIGYSGPYRKTADGMAATFQINSLAPYVLTCLMLKPKRLAYVTSGLLRDASPTFKDITWTSRRWNAYSAYAESKLQNCLLAAAVARKWPDVESASITPGWVATKIDGFMGPGRTEDGADTMTWLAGLPFGEGKIEGGKDYMDRKANNGHHRSVWDEKAQEEYLRVCGEVSGVEFPK
ncbi:MAG: hypothetical protein Q9162_001081 [Coniocarpon cinnabarinum]